jgi:hypothetical protein
MLTVAVPEFTRPTNSSMVIGGSPTAWTVVDFGIRIAIALLPSFEPQKRPFGTVLSPRPVSLGTPFPQVPQ